MALTTSPTGRPGVVAASVISARAVQAAAGASTPRPIRRWAHALLAGMAAAALCPLAFVSPARADSSPQITDHHAVVLVNLRDSSLSDPAVVHAKAVSQFFGRTSSLAAYYAANSHDRFSVVPAQGDGVFGPFSLDVDSAGCDSGKIADLARQAMPADVTYDDLSIVMPNNQACSWWGLATMPGPTTWFQEGAVNNDDHSAALHEFGHGLGFDHEGREVCPVGSFTGCTGDRTSWRTPMGGGGQSKGLSAPELMAKKWLPTQQISTPRSTTTVHLTPLHAQGNASGIRAVDLPLGTTGDRIVVEYRTSDPSTLDTEVPRGVDVFRIPQGNYTKSVIISNSKVTQKDNGSITANAPLTDTANHISLTVSNMTAKGVDLHVDLGSVPGHTTPPHKAHTTHASPAPKHSQSAQSGDSAKALGAKVPATPRATASSDHRRLPSTGAQVLTPTLIGPRSSPRAESSSFAASAGASTAGTDRAPQHLPERGGCPR